MDTTRSENIPGIDLPTFRQLVMAQQDKRSTRLENKFIERMEDSLIKWKPSVSSHRGTMMAIDGIHPYQLLDDSKNLTNNQSVKSRTDMIHFTALHKVENTSNRSKTSVIQNFINWIYNSDDVTVNENSNILNGIGYTSDDNESFEQDGFSFILPTANASNLTATPILFPRVARLKHVQGSLDHSRQQSMRKPLDGTERALYELYYNNPIPVDYLDATVNSNNNVSLVGANRAACNRAQNNTESQENHTEQNCLVCDNLGIIFPCLQLDTVSNLTNST
ncbi:hypothetical protein C6P45_000682 [Maudiozyma exigua]|uniref:Uncharacterized protein n=1 Tax=Maudiozyma exigua TaxID=34358 RepID=A0A9P6W6J2_MAUEX|nr:hypothetical protein C6P45_000682 [Kazachstania exigua]